MSTGVAFRAIRHRNRRRMSFNLVLGEVGFTSPHIFEISSKTSEHDENVDDHDLIGLYDWVNGIEDHVDEHEGACNDDCSEAVLDGGQRLLPPM